MKGEVTATIAVLRELQTVDDHLSQLQGSLADMSLTVSARNKRVKELGEQITKEQEALKKLESSSARRELDIKAHQEKVAKLKGQLNLVKTQKEYDAILHEISAEESDSSRAEDDALQMMTQLDDVKKALADLDGDLVEARKQVAKEQAKANEEVRRASSEMHQLRSERQALVARLDPDLLKRYDRILHNKHGKAVVEVVEHVCTGCNMGITKQNLARLMGGKEIIYCPNCMRILYLREEQ